MKNQEVSRKLLRAISIGLAATMTLTPTVTAFAEEAENDAVVDQVDDGDANEPEENNDDQNEDQNDDTNENDDDQNVDQNNDTDGNDGQESEENVNHDDSKVVEDYSEAIKGVEDPESKPEGSENVTPNPDATPVGNLVSDSAGALYDLENLSAGVEKINNTAVAANQTYEDSCDHAADLLEGEDGTYSAFNDATEKIEEVKNKESEAKRTSIESDGTYVEGIQKTYNNEDDAQAARKDVQEKIDKANEVFSDLGEVVNKAEQAVDTAEEKRIEAEEKLNKALEDKENAVKAVKSAKEAYEQLLKDNGIPYHFDKNNQFVIDLAIPEGKTLADFSAGELSALLNEGENNNLKKALDKVDDAYTEAEKKFNKANTEWETASGELSDAQKKAEAAAAALEKANDDVKAAEEAQGDANTKRSEAEKAQGDANAKKSEADQAQTTATQLAEDAANALSNANSVNSSATSNLTDKTNAEAEKKAAHDAEEKIQGIVKEARKKVIEAAKKYLQAKNVETTVSDRVDQLKTEYEDALKVYNDAKIELKAAQDNVKAIKAAIDKMEDNLTSIHVVGANKGNDSSSNHKKNDSSKKKDSDSNKSEETGSEGDIVPGSGLTDITSILQGVGAGAPGVFIEDSLGLFGGVTTPVNNLAAAADTTTTSSVFNVDTADGTTAETESEQAGTVVADSSSDKGIESDVLGERVAPIVDAVNDGTFTRDMLFDEEAKQIPIALWLLLLAFGAAGLAIYQKTRKKKIEVKSDK